MGCKYRVMDKCKAKDNIEDAFCFGKDGCPYYEDEVKAIPKAEVKKFLEEGAKDVSNKVLAIVREDYIHKSVYEARLKADMVAMLTELQLEIEDEAWKQGCASSNDREDEAYKIYYLIQQKIDMLKGEKE